VSQLRPIDHFPDPAVNSASAQLLEQHQHAFRYQRVVMQVSDLHLPSRSHTIFVHFIKKKKRKRKKKE
jgi:hypothetical protein